LKSNSTIFYSAKHINSPPHALLKPETQTINLPTSKAILDASESTDDAPKENLVFDWEVLDKPIGYEQTPAKLPATSTLTLEKLVSGSYTVRVKVYISVNNTRIS
jgi:hypothetical protein